MRALGVIITWAILLRVAVSYGAPPKCTPGDLLPIETYPELFTRARAGDQAAFAELDRRLRPVAFRLLRSNHVEADTAEDLAQEVMLRVLTTQETLDNPEGWVITAARNMAIDWHRRGGLRLVTGVFDPDVPSNLEPADPSSLGEGPRQEPLSFGADFWEHVGISAADAELYRLRGVEGRHFSEIARMVGRDRRQLEEHYLAVEHAVAAAIAQGGQLAQAMRRLSPNQHEALQCVESRRLSVQQAADEMRLPVNEARILLSDARAAVYPHLFGRRWTTHDLRYLRAPNVEAARLYLLDGLTHAQVAARLSIPVGTVKTRVRTARRDIAAMRETLSSLVADIPAGTGRRVAQLHYLEGHSATEIEAILALDPETVSEAILVARRAFVAQFHRDPPVF